MREKRLVSFANKMKCSSLEQFDVSLTYSINNNGPKMDPCGMPNVAFLCSSDDCVLSG